jgi:hypothetical protein
MFVPGVQDAIAVVSIDCICMHDIICVHKLFYCSPIGSSHCAACRSKWCPLHAPWKIKYNNFACKRRYMMHLLSCHIYALFTCMHNVVYSFVWPLCTHMLCTHNVVHTHTHAGFEERALFRSRIT